MKLDWACDRRQGHGSYPLVGRIQACPAPTRSAQEQSLHVLHIPQWHSCSSRGIQCHPRHTLHVNNGYRAWLSFSQSSSLIRCILDVTTLGWNVDNTQEGFCLEENLRERGKCPHCLDRLHSTMGCPRPESTVIKPAAAFAQAVTARK